MTHHSQTNSPGKYPLLEEFLALNNLTLQPIYSTRDLASLFKVSARAIQNWITAGRIVPRNLPGRGKFLPLDLEALLASHRTAA